MIEIRSRAGGLGYQALAVAAFFVLALAFYKPTEIGVAIGATVLLLATSVVDTAENVPKGVLASASLAAALLLVLSLPVTVVGGISVSLLGPFSPTIAFVLPAALLIALAWRGPVDLRWARLVIAGCLAVMIVAVGALSIDGLPDPVIDVLDVHRSATDVLVDGRNPYRDVVFHDTSRPAPTEELVGYPYPPTTLVAFVAADLLFGDPRWAGVVAMVVVVTLVLQPWKRMTRIEGGALVVIGTLLAIQPLLRAIFRAGWTDAIALPFVLGAGLLWRKHPLIAAGLLGVAFGSKQYLVLALPVMLLFRDDDRWKRFGVATGVAALTLLPAFVADWSAAWDAMIAPFLDAPIRLDSLGLAGLGLDVPSWVVAVVTVSVAAFMGRSGGGAPRFMLALAGTLAIAFVVGSQAFLNYWFFVGALALLAAGVSATTETVREREPVGAAAP